MLIRICTADDKRRWTAFGRQGGSACYRRRVNARGKGDNHFKILKVRVKKSLYCPGQALRVTGG
jgi:hypothetical protein